MGLIMMIMYRKGVMVNASRLEDGIEKIEGEQDCDDIEMIMSRNDEY